MAWIEIHDNLPDHPKIVDLSLRLKIDRDACVGKMVRLWEWVLINRETGVIRDVDTPLLPEVMRLSKLKPDVLMRELINAKLVDQMEDGSCMIHDWEEHVSMLLAKREEKRAQNRARVQRYRERTKSTECNADVTHYNGITTALSNAATVPNRTIDNTDRQTDPTAVSKCIYETMDRVYQEIDYFCLDELRREPNAKETRILEKWWRNQDDAYNLMLVRTLAEAQTRGAQSPADYAEKCFAEYRENGIESLPDRLKWRIEHGYD